MMTRTIPAHLQKYIVEQNYARYTPEDQAVWRFTLRQLKNFLSTHGHQIYSEGLAKTGIEIDRIPDISVMDRKLSEFGWRAVAVSGFIPPAAFMEFQSMGILPIASDMRSMDHLAYTPAPDIVHEAAGHAPMLVLPEYANYLKSYAEIARNAILMKEDLQQYEAIRVLSDVKENPDSTPEVIRQAEERLEEVNRQIPAASEAGWLSRMNWWTAEYGLVGPVDNPKIFGAGLLSSVGESRHCLSSKVKKIPLSIDCIQMGYDITEPQPQLFVAEDFQHLHRVLNELAEKLSFRRGGRDGLSRAQESRTVNTVELDSGLQISGALEGFEMQNDRPIFFKFSGPVALATNRVQILNHGTDRHGHGFSSPLGTIAGKSLSTASDSDLRALGIERGKPAHLKFDSGIELKGEVVGWTREKNKVILIEFAKCSVNQGAKVLYQPDWGPFDLAVGNQVVSVFGGPADRMAYGDSADFVNARVPSRKISSEQQRQFDFYSTIRRLREKPGADPTVAYKDLVSQFEKHFRTNWLMAVELVELGISFDQETVTRRLKDQVTALTSLSPAAKECLHDGLSIAGKTL